MTPSHSARTVLKQCQNSWEVKEHSIATKAASEKIQIMFYLKFLRLVLKSVKLVCLSWSGSHHQSLVAKQIYWPTDGAMLSDYIILCVVVFINIIND